MISLVVIVLIIWGAAALFKKDSYIGFYYPDASNLFNDIQSESPFGSLNDCRAWVNEQKHAHNPDGIKQDDYECGKNCDLQNGQKPYVCEETLE